MQFASFDADRFLREYWQKRPLLIRNPWRNWTNPLEPDELAGLACEAEVEARLIWRDGASWAMENGPFAEDRFAAVGAEPWTLLVQAVDHYVPDVAALIAPFRFVPNWRIDDVMVSYASDGGGVGPHFDQYDVFLIQGLGRRRWRLGARCDATTALLPHDDLKLLAEFTPTEEWVLEPGDILYVPPGVAHDGVALGDDCMTYSVGFRAPERGELIADWCDHVLEGVAEDDLYTDPDLQAQPNPGEIAAAALDRVHAMVLESLGDRAAFARWFGRFISTPKYPAGEPDPDDRIDMGEVRAALAGGGPLYRNPASRFSFIREDGGQVALFVDGEHFACAGEAAAFAEQLCAGDEVPVNPAWGGSEPVVELVARLIDLGSVSFELED